MEEVIESEKLSLLTVVSKQIESRTLSIDITRGAQIIWADVAPQLSRLCGKVFSPREAQRLWRRIAYNDKDTGPTESDTTLPDSDEDLTTTSEKKSIKPNDTVSRGLAARSRFREISNSDSAIETYAEGVLPPLVVVNDSSCRLEEALQLRENRKRELMKLITFQNKKFVSKPIVITKALDIAASVSSIDTVLGKKSILKRKREEESSELSMKHQDTISQEKKKYRKDKQPTLKDWVASLGLVTPLENQYQLAHSIVRKAWKQQARQKIPVLLKKKGIK